MQDATLLAIWIKRSHGGPMDPVTEAEVLAGHGITGNANQGGKRQITILDEEAWRAAMRALGAHGVPSTRRANLLVQGISLVESAGRTLRVGDLRILIRGETRPCDLMEAALPGLREALSRDWRGGAYGEALDDAALRVGDGVSWDVPR